MQEARLLPFAFARDFGILAKRSDAMPDATEVWLSTETPPSALAEVARRFGRLQLHSVASSELEQAIARAYAGSGGDASQVADEFDADLDLTKLMQDVPAIEDLLESADDAPVIRMINALLTQALRESASDIHIEPFEQTSVVRFRIDGSLRDVIRPKKAIHASLISRIKIMAALDIAEKRLPQDGRITLRVGGKPVDVRVSTLPTGHGERAVLRLLDKEAKRLDLAHLGMSETMLPKFDGAINQPHGIVLVTGPTGSGKTTTLYAALSRLNASTTNILTVEDPIEYDLAGVGQTQVNAKIDMSFAKALRSILRQDPDVIMIGEIRDLETAQIAVQASLTGHLVLATLHTNDSIAAVTRLLDMGIEPFLLSSSLLGVVAQRLVRQLCTHCRRHDGQIWHAVGCDKCGRSGYQGRVGVYELLLTTDKIRAMIHNRASEADIRAVAQEEGMVTMREDGQRWLEQGVTTEAELIRVTKD
ncbi:MAG: type II secretion system ATPase GspE [Burkholderiales bacterium]|nr:type II secretion system ATPase GspE [Burkholderiales bacterium]